MYKPDPRYKAWVRDTRMPVPAPPPGSCCCQIHIYEDPDKYPTRPDPPYEAIDATFAGTPSLLRRKSTTRYFCLWPPPR